MKFQKEKVVFLKKLADGFIFIPCYPALEKEITAGREFMREYHGTFHQSDP